MKSVHVLFALILLMSFHSCKKEKSDIPIKTPPFVYYVNPFIGTGGHGHTYPGATVPFGMLQVSPDNGISDWDWCSGYHYSDSITIGFSHLHLSGTGIGDLADIRLMPINKKIDLSIPINSRDDVPYKSSYSHANETASAGYYSVFLKDHNIKAELTSSLRTAYHKYTYAKGDEQSVVIDLGFKINWDKPTDTKISIIDNYTISGYRHSTGWAKNQKVFFVAKFSKPINNYELVQDENYITEINNVIGEKTYAQLFFNSEAKEELLVKVAVSSVSEENALLNLSDKEIDFENIKSEANAVWEENLSKITVETDNDNLKTIFYTALYHTQIAPVTFSDVNGEFRKENDSIEKASNYTAYSTLSLWDTFRAEHPLLTITSQDKVADIINSMLAYFEVKNILPVWTLYGNETNTMTGYHSIPVIAEAFKKGIKGFDAEKAYEAMKTTMMQDERGLNHYKKYGYVPHDLLDESVTITLEYAYNDWCVAMMAKALGKDADYNYFIKRSEAYKHLFDPETGFMRGKNKAGNAWKTPFDPKYSAHRVHAEYTEGNAWQHSWFVLHDTKNLIEMHGGEEAFTSKLEQLFTESSEITGENVSADISGLVGQYAHGNEPSHHIAYMFNFANKPWKTQYWVHEILKTQYDATPEGLSGNEDCGQMSAWYVFSSIGLYPFSPASGNYQIGSPLFKKTTINVSENKSFVIKAENVSEDHIYIQSAKLNGKPFNKTVITHKQLLEGGTLEFVMGTTPNKNWGITKNTQN
ncbi:GH92 family glycosyl hydrolase [Flavivirga aquimarina]|uniref:GH92 family glycosyl hydrolase n=1 Tax=Flavivirga aquimarina TaxID=2027862 RepID=A0ABT8WFJ9_9FLAO|nr:GH92 family glycosyl hydrolase [Flavivirga aquimarina]MDO5971942.1 GH92 family glycosyl hydrolase [Flavivirga aquimarina]